MCMLDEICAKRDEIYAVARVHKAEKLLSLDDLIINKRSSGRPKDIADAVTLEKLREKKNG